MEKILTKTIEYVAISEEEAEALVAQAKQEAQVENSIIKYKKETKNKMEHWIVVIKLRYDYADAYVSYGSEE